VRVLRPRSVKPSRTGRVEPPRFRLRRRHGGVLKSTGGKCCRRAAAQGGAAADSILDQALVEAEGQGLLDDVERLRHATIELRGARGELAVRRQREAVAFVEGLDLARAESVARAFTVYFQLVNLAEERSACERCASAAASRRRSASPWPRRRRAAREPGEEACAAAGPARDQAGADRPSDGGRRRAVVDALRRIAGLVDRLDDRGWPSPSSGTRSGGCTRSHVLWRTSQLRSERPSPLDEVRA